MLLIIWFIDVNGEKIGKSYNVPSLISYEQLLRENVIGCSTVLLKKEILPPAPFKSNYFHEDYVLWLKLLKKQIKAVGISRPLVKYRIGGRSSNKIKAACYRWKIYRKEERLPFIKSLFYFSIFFNGLKKIAKDKDLAIWGLNYMSILRVLHVIDEININSELIVVMNYYKYIDKVR